MVHAPPYDPHSELDPATAESIRDSAPDDLENLAYYQEQHTRQTNRARAGLLTVIFVMLAGNMFLTWQTASVVMGNLNQTRLDQAALSDMVQTRVTALETQIVTLQAQVAANKPVEPVAIASE
jgi:hypothetical protein